jgi:hypothetical protein
MLHYNNYYINVTVSDTSTPMGEIYLGEIYLSEFNCMTFV